MDMPQEVQDQIREMVRSLAEEAEDGVRHAEQYHTFDLAERENEDKDRVKLADEVNKAFVAADPPMGLCLSPEDEFKVTAQVKTLAWSVLYDAMHGNEGRMLQQATLAMMMRMGIEPVHPDDDHDKAVEQTRKYTPMMLRYVFLYLAEQLRLEMTPSLIYADAEEARNVIWGASLDELEERVQSGEISTRALLQLIRSGSMIPPEQREDGKDDRFGHGSYL